MGRFECDEEDFPGQSALWEQSGRNALRGKRGQAFLREMEAALLAMPEPRLIAEQLCDPNGDVCLIGQVAINREVQAGRDRAEVISAWSAASMEEEDYSDVEATCETVAVGERLGMARAMASYAAFQNDTCRYWHPPLLYGIHPTPEQRWEQMLKWVQGWLAGEHVAGVTQ